MSPIFWASVLAVAVAVVYASTAAYNVVWTGAWRALVKLIVALALPLALLPVLAVVFVVIFRYTTEAGGAEVQARSLLGSMTMELGAGFLAALSIMPYHAGVIAAIALFMVIRQGVSRRPRDGGGSGVEDGSEIR